jgi:hypothetical protein
VFNSLAFNIPVRSITLLLHHIDTPGTRFRSLNLDNDHKSDRQKFFGVNRNAVLYPEVIAAVSSWLSAATPPEPNQQNSLPDSEGVTDKPVLRCLP